MNVRRTAMSLLTSVLLALAACTDPRALRPVVDSPLQSRWQGTSLTSATAPEPFAWWSVFHDPVLDQLMSRALAGNLDLKLAQARIDQARAQQRAAGAALLPDVSATLQDAYVHNPAQPAFVPKLTLTAALEASWTVDLSGQLRNQRRAAIAAARAAEFDRQTAEITLLAQVATDYIQYRLYQSEYAISVRNAASQEETVRITRLRFEQGAASRLDLEQLVSQLAITRAAVPQAREQADTARQAIVLLLASTPEALAEALPEAMPEQTVLPGGDPVAVLLTPAQVIAGRPDIRSAAQQLLSAAASLRATEAQRYPELSLAGLFGQEATNWASFPRAASRAWSYSEGLLAPVLDFGRIRANIDLANAQQQQAYLDFEQTVRTALEATQTAIVLYTQGQLRAAELRHALDAARNASLLARRQYDEGALALLNVLDAERTEYATELTWAEAAAAVSVRLVTLYQTLGTLPPTPVPASSS